VSACYTACRTQDPGEIRKLTLVNCAWTLQDPSALSDDSRRRYTEEENTERAEFEEFRRTMIPVKKCFADIGVDFHICFYTFHDFLAMLKKTDNELHYLQRYTV